MQSMQKSMKVAGLALSIFVFSLFSAGAQQQVYPLKGGVTLSYWMVPAAVWMNRFKNFGETPYAKELEKRTGVKIEYNHPVFNQAQQNYNLMLASGKLTDLIEQRFLIQPGGPEKAMRDGYIIDLREPIKKWAPNLSAYLKKHPEIDKMIRTDDGSYYVFPFIRDDPSLLVSRGIMIRQDWLEELKLPVPTTIDEWVTVLRAFKDKKGATAPLTWAGMTDTFGEYNQPAFSSAWGIIKNWYVDDGKVKYGPLEPGYKDFVSFLARLYKEGLLDPNIALVDNKMRDANFATGKTGATIGSNGSVMGALVKMLADKDPKAKLIGVPYPTLKKGDTPTIGFPSLPFDQWGVAISSKCKNIEAAVRFLDYGYSQEGIMLNNYGIENVSYKYENGEPVYTDLVLKNPKGLSIAEAQADYIRSVSVGPFIQIAKHAANKALLLPEQKQALEVWTKTNPGDKLMPTLTPTAEESSEISKIYSEVKTYTDEMFTKFVLGIEPIDNFPKYLETLKKLKIERAISLYQNAYDRYRKR